MKRIPALTLHRPWTTCVVDLPEQVAKRPENRGWTRTYRGPVLLHGGKAWDPSAFEVARQAVQAIGARIDVGGVAVCLDVDALLAPDPADHPTGFLAVADLVDICSGSFDTSRLACDCGPWAFPGQHHWRFDNVRRLADPVPWTGAQGLWWPPPDALRLVAAQLGRVAA